MNGRADVVCGSSRVDGVDPEHGSGVGPAPACTPSLDPCPLASSLALAALDTAPSCAAGGASALAVGR